MQIKNLYKYDNGRQLFRLLPTDTGKLVIEERDRTIKEAFFSCLDVYSGRIIFSDLQFDEKYWIGIEKIYKDVILFHRFERPDLPNHRGIVAYGIKSQSVLWELPHKLLFAADDKIYLIQNDFGIQRIIAIDYLSGEMENIPNELFDVQPEKEEFNNYFYSNKLSQNEFFEVVHPDLKKCISDYLIKDSINFISKDQFSFFSFHYISDNKKFDNIFFATDQNGTIIFQEKLNSGLDKLEPESFFIKDDLLFLLFGSTGFGVYQII